MNFVIKLNKQIGLRIFVQSSVFINLYKRYLMQLRACPSPNIVWEQNVDKRNIL